MVFYVWREPGAQHPQLLTKPDYDLRRGDVWDEEWRALNARVLDGVAAQEWGQVKLAYFQQALMLFRRETTTSG